MSVMVMVFLLPRAVCADPSPPLNNAPTCSKSGAFSTCQEQCAQCKSECTPEQARACYVFSEYFLHRDRFDLKTTIRHLETACRHNAPAACTGLGNFYMDGRGVAKDNDRGMALYAKDCQSGVGVGCFNQANVFASGTVGEIDSVRAKELYEVAAIHYEKQCQDGDLIWCVNLGVIYQGEYLSRDSARALSYYQKACAGGEHGGCVNSALRKLLSNKGRPTVTAEDREAAIVQLEAACDANEGFGCWVLARHLWSENHDLKRVHELLDRGCNLATAQACDLLGALHGVGEGTPVSTALSNSHFERACVLGWAESCHTLGKVHLEQKAFTKAAQWFQAACHIGYAESCAVLGIARQRGLGVGLDPKRMIEHFTESCRMAYPAGCVELINRDLPLPLPDERRQKMYEGACQRGITKACDKITTPSRRVP